MIREELRASRPTVMIVATLDTKAYETDFVRKKIESLECGTILVNPGILSPPQSGIRADIDRDEVAKAGGKDIDRLLATRDKGLCIRTMMDGVAKITRELFEKGLFHGIISIGGAQNTDIGTSAMRALPFGIPKLMVSTVASGQAAFGPFVGTKDIIIMHSVADIQGLNFITRRVLGSAAAAVCGMVKEVFYGEGEKGAEEKTPVAMSMLGTTTPGALRAKELLERRGYEVVAFHQNGTGGIAMEDMIVEGRFKGVLDLNLHEIADWYVGGLHGAIKDYRLEMAGKCGLPQVVAPGSINYTVQGPYDKLPEDLKRRKLIVHNPNLTLVRLSVNELAEVGKITAEKLNRAKGKVCLFIPLRGFSYPDREGHPHWEPEGNMAFIRAVEENLDKSVELEKIDAHINDPEFIDVAVGKFLQYMEN
ncbi:MAG: UPF0261 family protein [Spirochaetes bacterium]|nr:MAG: UPF0261 family protein [Spirochaetota bacterium]